MVKANMAEVRARVGDLALITNQAIRSRLSHLLGYSHGGERDLYDAFGYERVVSTQALAAMYQRNDIAERLIRAFTKATWRDKPIIRDEAGSGLVPGEEGFSPFAYEVDRFLKDRKLYRTIERADRLSTVGRFGILYLGFDDGDRVDQPLPPGKHKLLYAQPYMDNSITIDLERDESDARFGLPKHYQLNSSDDLSTADQSVSRKSLRVHHSRVVHIAENLDEDDVYGTPRLLSIYNRLKDLEKVVGGSAETFWVTANRGIAFWGDKETTLDEEEIKKIQDRADEFVHGLKRTIAGSGMTAQVLGTDSPDPEMISNVLLDLIAGAKGIPRRILTGSERGELSSSQDENNWSTQIRERKEDHAGACILQPIIDLLILTGNVPKPQGQWWIEWPEDDGLSEEAKANIASVKATAIVNYSNSPNASFVVPVEEFREKVLGLPATSEYEADDEDFGSDGFDEDEADKDDAEMEEEVANSANLKTLYAYRPVRNWKTIDKWARGQGLTTTGKDMHVTMCYSKKKVDWASLAEPYDTELDGSITITENKSRAIEKFGNAIVLTFTCSDLAWRNSEMKWAGVASDFEDFRPHITLAYEAPEGLALTKIKPFLGNIVLEAEVFQELEKEIDDGN